MRTIYILGYNFTSAITAILLKNFFKETKDIRIVDLEEKNNLNNFNAVESREIFKILKLNNIDINDFIFNTDAVPYLGSVYYNFIKKDVKNVLLHDQYKNLKTWNFKKLLNLNLTEEDEAEHTSKLFYLYKNNEINLKKLNKFGYSFNLDKTTKWLINDIFIKKLRGRIVKFKINQIVYDEKKYIKHLITNISNGLTFKADLYINCTDNLFKTEKTNLLYNDHYIQASFLYKNKDKQIKNIKKYFAFDNGYLLERYLWNKIEITYFFNLKNSTKFEIYENIHKYIINNHKINYLNFEIKEIKSYFLKKIYDKNIVHLNNVTNYLEPLLENNIDNIINNIYNLISILEEKNNISVLYKNYFNNKYFFNYNQKKINYLSFLSKTERIDTAYWNEIFEYNIIDNNLKLNNTCVDLVKNYNTLEIEFYENLLNNKLKLLDNKILVNKKLLYNSMPLMVYLNNIFNKDIN